MGGMQSYFSAAAAAAHHVIVLRVPGSGRKTLARALLSKKHLETLQLEPSLPKIAGMEVLTSTSSSTSLRVTTWSVGGSDRMKALWGVWAEGATCVVFAVDASDARSELVAAELKGLGEMAWTKKLPL
eukprot:gene30372-5197_t